MGITHHIDVDLGVIFAKVDGEHADVGMDWRGGAILADPDYRPGMNGLMDMSGVTKISATTEGLRALAGEARRLHPPLWGKRLAIVVSDEVGFGVGRQYQAMRMESPYEIRVFRSVVDAQEWLGIRPGL